MEDFLEKGWWVTGKTGALIQQHPDIKKFMTRLLLETSPSLIIEIGTSFGGLAVILSEIIEEHNLSTVIHSYDPNTRQGLFDTVQEYGFQFFEKGVKDPSVDKEITQKIQNTPGRVLLLCDGGDKSWEFNTFAASLKPGDIIGGHDYADDDEDFELRVKGKLWNWLELVYNQVAESIAVNELKDLPNNLTEEGKQVVWLLKMK
jgi:hypothetical protein